MNYGNMIRNLEAKLLRQEQAAQETRDHILVLKKLWQDEANKDQHPLPLPTTSDGKNKR